MDVDTAMAIVKEAQSGGFLDGDIPEEDEQLLSLAGELFNYAQKDFKSGLKDPTVIAIVELGNGYSLKPVAVETVFDLPAPSQPRGSHPEMPDDITTPTDLAIRRLSGQFNNLLARAKYLLAQETNKLAGATHLRDEAYRIALMDVDRLDEETNKTKLKEIIESEARDDSEYKSWNTAVKVHTENVNNLKALADIYSGNIDRLSREMTFRKDDWEKTK